MAQTVVDGTDAGHEGQLQSLYLALQDELRDPFSAVLRNLVIDAAGMVCGEINATNGFGAYVGYRPFLFAPFDDLLLILPQPGDALHDLFALNIRNTCGEEFVR